MTQRKRGQVSRLTGPGNTSPSGGNFVADLKQASLKVLAALPSGKSVKAADFHKTFGKDAGDALTNLGVTEVSRNGSRIELKRSSVSTVRFGGADITLATLVAFDVAQRANGIDVTNIKGVKVDAGALIPKLDLKSVSITDLPSGNTTVSMKLKVSRFLPDLTHTVTVKPDGQVV